MPAERSDVSGHRRARNRSRAPWVFGRLLTPVSMAHGLARNDQSQTSTSGTDHAETSVDVWPNALTAFVHRPIIANNNSNLNTLSGVGNIINSNPIVNIQSSREAFVNYAPVNNFITSGRDSAALDPAQEQVGSALTDVSLATAHASNHRLRH